MITVYVCRYKNFIIIALLFPLADSSAVCESRSWSKALISETGKKNRSTVEMDSVRAFPKRSLYRGNGRGDGS